MRSMATEVPAWVKRMEGMRDRMHSPKYTPRARPDTQPAEGPVAVSKAVRSEAVARSHNTFRPDIYRVSEGYLN